MIPINRISLDFASGTPLVQQFAASMRAAIRAGDFRIGEILPPVKEWADALGCSAFVPRRAMGMLAKEGALAIKRHVGAVVTGRLAPERKKLVIYVTRDNGDIWSRNVFAFRLGEVLMKSGYRFEHVRINRRSHDFACEHLTDAIRRGVDFAVCEVSQTRFTEPFRMAGIPFAVISVGNEDFRGAEAVFNRVDDELVNDIVGLLKRAKCRRVALYGAGEWVNDRLSVPFFKAGIHLQRRNISPLQFRQSGHSTVGSVQRSAMESFESMLSAGAAMPDAFVFYDDYIAAGAFLSLARHGVDIPKDVKVLTFSNKGLGPVFFRPLTRFESDHAKNAERIGRWIKAWLSGRRIAPPRIAARLIRGETM